MLIAWLHMGKILLETVWGNLCYCFSFKFRFFKVKHSTGHISGMVGPTDMKQKGCALVIYWVYYGISPFDLTHDLGRGLFKVKFEKSCISGVVGLVDTGPNMLYCPLTAPMKWPWRIKVNAGNSLISGLIQMERKGCESSIHGHDIDFVVLSWWGGWMYCIGTRWLQTSA